MTTPLSKDNCWRRYFKPRLEGAGLGWVNFQVMVRHEDAFFLRVKDPSG